MNLLNISQKIKHFILPILHFLFSLSILFLPKSILLFIIKMYADIKFYFLKKENKAKKDKEIPNLFMTRSANPSNLRLTENRIAETDRSKKRSLRNIVMENRVKMKPATTVEEKSLHILSQVQ